ncbi:hypothetical protein BDZ89DRAFT_1168584 [Hymenopellis radicata]|nr:hypothetical protein BDZ89DRAFT_1168584 [Hymenopellis radicata]
MISLLTLRVTATVVHGVAQICTILRLVYQKRKHRMWLDDGFVAASLFCSMAWLACFWIQTNVEGMGPLYRLPAYWTDSVTFLTVVWFTRTSVLLSTVRLAPPGLVSRQIPFFASILFLMMWGALLIQRIYMCHHDSSWESMDEPRCTNMTMKITGSACELFSDLILMVAPIAALASAPVARKQHRLLLITFISALTFTCVSVAHAVYTLRNFGDDREDLTAIVQSGTSLLFSNLVVGIMFAHHRMNPNVEYPDEFSDVSYGASSRRKRGSSSAMKARIGSPKALNSIHLKLDRESFGTSSPLRYMDDGDSTKESTVIAPFEFETTPRDSAIGMSYIPDMKVPYGVTLSPRLLDPHYADDTSKGLRSPSYQSCISVYSKEADRESSLSTYPMLQDDAELLTPPPPTAVMKNVRFLSPLPKAGDRSTASTTFSSVLNSYLVNDAPASNSNRSHRQNVAIPPKTVPPFASECPFFFAQHILFDVHTVHLFRYLSFLLVCTSV